MKTFEQYRPRTIQFNQLFKVAGWEVKVYSITNRTAFGSAKVLNNALLNLPTWLAKSARLNWPTYGVAFLIVHEGKDGVWTLLNWWIGGEILQGMTFYTSFDAPEEFKPASTEGLLACVWELEVIAFERAMWIEYVLKKSRNPDFNGYLQKTISQVVSR